MKKAKHGKLKKVFWFKDGVKVDNLFAGMRLFFLGFKNSVKKPTKIQHLCKIVLEF